MTKREVVEMFKEMIKDIEAKSDPRYRSWWIEQRLTALKTAIKLLSKK